MDDFLYNVRTGNMRNDKSNRRYDNNRYKSQNRQPAKDRRKGGYVNYRSLATDQFSAIKEVLGTLVQNQGRQTVALEKIAESLATLVSTGMTTMGSLPKPEVSPPSPTVEVDATEHAAEHATNTTTENEPTSPPQTRAEMVGLIHQLREEKLSYEKIADIFESKQIATLSGRGKWRGQTIYRLFNEK